MCIKRQSSSERCCIRPVYRIFPPLKSLKDLICLRRRYSNLKTISAKAQVSSYCSCVTQLGILRFRPTFHPGIPVCFLRPVLSRHFSIDVSSISSPRRDDILVCLPFVSLDDVCRTYPRLLGQKPGFRHALVHSHHLLRNMQCHLVKQAHYRIPTLVQRLLRFRYFDNSSPNFQRVMTTFYRKWKIPNPREVLL